MYRNLILLARKNPEISAFNVQAPGILCWMFVIIFTIIHFRMSSASLKDVIHTFKTIQISKAVIKRNRFQIINIVHECICIQFNTFSV